MASKRPLIVAIIFGIIAVILVYAYMKSMEKQLSQTGVEYGSVVVAVDQIAVRESIKEGMVAEAKWPVENIPAKAFTEVDEVLGMIASENIYAGLPLFPDQFKDVVEMNELSFRLEAEERAVTIGVTEIKAVGGNVKPGDHVDILATFDGSEEVGAATTITVLRDIRVVAVGTDIGGQIEEGSEAASVSKSITVAVTPRDAEILTLVDETGNIRISLRPTEELYAPPSMGVTITDLVDYRMTRADREEAAKAAENERKWREDKAKESWKADARPQPSMPGEKPSKPLPPMLTPQGPKMVNIEVISGGQIQTIAVPEDLYYAGYSTFPMVRYDFDSAAKLRYEGE